MQKLRRNKKETRLEYIKRLTYGKLKDKTIDADYSEIAPYLFGAELNSHECRKRMYGVLNILEQLEEEVVEGISDSDLLDEITLKTLELKKERQKNQTINAQINKNLRLISRKYFSPLGPFINSISKTPLNLAFLNKSLIFSKKGKSSNGTTFI